MTPNPPDFSSWDRQTLERFAAEAFAKLAEHHREMIRLRDAIDDAMRRYPIKRATT